MHRLDATQKAHRMPNEQQDLEKKFDALVAQLPRHRRPSKRILPWVLGIIAAFAAVVTIGLKQRSDSRPAIRVQFPLAVCGNGKLEPGEDCELEQSDCPKDCIQRDKSAEATTPTKSRQGKE